MDIGWDLADDGFVSETIEVSIIGRTAVGSAKRNVSTGVRWYFPQTIISDFQP